MYSDQLNVTAVLKVVDFQFLKVLESIRLSLQLCTILVQFVIFTNVGSFLDTMNPFIIPTLAVLKKF